MVIGPAGPGQAHESRVEIMKEEELLRQLGKMAREKEREDEKLDDQIRTTWYHSRIKKKPAR
jgi:hypothetical protein